MASTQLRGGQIAPLPLDAASGEVSGTLPVGNGGTGQTSTSNAFNALAPSQTGNGGKVLKTDGSAVSWVDMQTLSLFGHWFTTWQTGDADPTAGGSISRPSGLRVLIHLGTSDLLPSWAASGDIVLRDA